MTYRMLMLAAVGLSTGLLVACGGDSSAPTPVSAAPQSLNTSQVLSLAQQTSETSTPIPVDGGALTINDTSETTRPIAVSAM